jgi:hypothetical protein
MYCIINYYDIIKGVCPIWFTAVMTEQRKKEKDELFRKEMAEQFKGIDYIIISHRSEFLSLGLS